MLLPELLEPCGVVDFGSIGVKPGIRYTAGTPCFTNEVPGRFGRRCSLRASDRGRHVAFGLRGALDDGVQRRILGPERDESFVGVMNTGMSRLTSAIIWPAAFTGCLAK